MCRSWSLRMKFKKKWKSSLAESIPSRSYLTHCAVFWQNCAPTTDSSLPPQPHLHLQRQHCTNPLWSSPLPYLSARVPPGNILSFENIPIRLVSVERKSVHHHSKLRFSFRSTHPIPVAVLGFLLSPEIPAQTQIWVCSQISPWLSKVILPPNHSSGKLSESIWYLHEQANCQP